MAAAGYKQKRPLPLKIALKGIGLKKQIYGTSFNVSKTDTVPGHLSGHISYVLLHGHRVE